MKVSQNYINLFHSETDHVGETTTFNGIRVGGIFREKVGARKYFQKISDNQAIEIVMPSQVNKHGYMASIINFTGTVDVVKCRGRLNVTLMEGI